MPLLFSYGTLQNEAVQRSTFGRPLAGSPDELPGFERATVTITDAAFIAASGTAEHASVTYTGLDTSRVSGMAFVLSDDELAQADEYEPEGYDRVQAGLASGRVAWVYLFRSDGVT